MSKKNLYKIMYIITDLRTKKQYRTPYSIKEDTLRMLHALPFIKAKELTEEETTTNTLCTDKWNFITQFKADGRTKQYKKLPYFTWLIVLDKLQDTPTS